MANEKVQIMFPVGRLVGGSLTTGKTKKANGEPLTNRDGSPGQEFSFGVAFPKNGTSHFRETAWGAAMWNAGQAAFPAGQANAPTFAWKVTDGDSQIPNKKGKKPSDNVDFRGCWIVWFSTRFAPKCVNKDGTVQIPAETIKLGYYVQVHGTVAGNTGDSPGIYVNHNFVSFQAKGVEIETGPDASELGFGQSALPAGAQPLAESEAAGLGFGAGTTPPPPAAAPAPAPAVHATTPDPSVLAAGGSTPPPPPPAAAAVPPPPPAARTKQDRMVGGLNYDAAIAAGWTDESLIQHGHMQAA